MTLDNFRRASLKTRVTLLTLVIFLISVWSLAFYVSRLLREDMQGLLGEQQFATTSFVAESIEHELNQRLQALETVAANVSAPVMADRSALQALLEKQGVFQNLFNAGAFVTDADGTPIADIPVSADRLGRNVRERDYMLAALKEGRSSVGGVVLSKSLRTPVFSLAAPIRDAQGRVSGALVGVTNLGLPNFLDRVAQGSYGKSGGYLLIDRKQQLFVSANDKARIMQTVPALTMKLLQGGNTAPGGYRLTRSAAGVEELTATKNIPVANWTLVSTWPTAEAFAPIQAMQRNMLAATLLLTLLAGGLTWWAISWMLKRQLSPMLAASRALQQLSDPGQAPQPLPIARQDEIGELIGGFNRLLQTLSERETALKESQERYRTLVEWTPEPIAVHRAGKLLYVNPAAVKMVGARTAQDLIGKPILELIHPDFHQIVLARVKQQMEDGVAPPVVEEKFLKLDGTPIDVLVQPTPIIFDGKPAIHAAMRDITEQKQVSLALVESRARFQNLFLQSPVPMVLISANGAIEAINEKWLELFGYSLEDIPTIDAWWPLAYPDAAYRAEIVTAWQAKRGRALQDGSAIAAMEVRITCKDGIERDVVISGAFVGNQILVTLNDITQSKAAQDRIKQLAFFDPLTLLPNRRLLLDRLQQTLAASLRHRRKGALLFVDLDDFKTLNETLGHDKGDLLLPQVAKSLLACVREGDTVARFGGDKFVVLLEGLSASPQEAATQAEAVGGKILAALGRRYLLADFEHHNSASIGVTLFGGEQSENIEEPVKRAELAMYQAKAAGRNTLRFFEPQMQAVVSARAAMEGGLREAIQGSQLVLYYQAQVNGKGEPTGAEALVRWQHPRRGLVPPVEFIGLAEETGLILPLGQWVLETACTQLAHWARQPPMAHLTVAVNVSARQFHHKDFVSQVLAVLEHTGANPNRLKLELTESLLVTDVEAIIARMNTLKAHGVGFSLDDFGTGYSSLTYLKRMPLEQLKIDRSFVRNILLDANDAAISKMVVALADSLGLAVIAEGVEEVAQRNFLAELGCHEYQGYLFSRPLPIEGFEAFMRQQIAAARLPG